MTDAKTGRTTKLTAAADYNVYKNKARKTCVSYAGGGSPTPASSYEHKFGPDTLAACDTWIENNCKDGGGTQCS
jgi:hypothetical protein